MKQTIIVIIIVSIIVIITGSIITGFKYLKTMNKVEELRQTGYQGGGIVDPETIEIDPEKATVCMSLKEYQEITNLK